MERPRNAWYNRHLNVVTFKLLIANTHNSGSIRHTKRLTNTITESSLFGLLSNETCGEHIHAILGILLWLLLDQTSTEDINLALVLVNR